MEQELVGLEGSEWCKGKISKRRHPRPLSMHRNLRRKEEARNGNKKQSWRWE